MTDLPSIPRMACDAMEIDTETAIALVDVGLYTYSLASMGRGVTVGVIRPTELAGATLLNAYFRAAPDLWRVLRAPIFATA